MASYFAPTDTWDDGTLGAPGFANDVQANMGLYRPATDVFGFVVNAAEVMRLKLAATIYSVDLDTGGTNARLILPVVNSTGIYFGTAGGPRFRYQTATTTLELVDTTAAAYFDFAAKDISATGILKIGATVSTTGNLRIGNLSSIAARNAANTGDELLIRYSATDIIELGAGNSSDARSYGASFAIGGTPSTTGALRLANNVGIRFRNAANTANINTLVVDNANIVYLGDGTAGVKLQPAADTLDIVYAVTALGGGAISNLGTIGGAGPAAAAQNSWLKILINGTASFIPIWR